MLTIRSVLSGRILGFARTWEVANELAKTNNWTAWVVEDDEPLPELQLVPREPDTDPCNCRGAKTHDV